MIVTKLMGGLGNQMFQYAAAIGASHINEIPYVDLSMYQMNGHEDTSRGFELGQLTTKYKILSRDKKIDLCSSKSYWLRHFFSENAFLNIEEKFFQFESSVLKHKDKNLYLSGYWQSYKYFEHVRKRLIEDFTPSGEISPENSELITQILSCESVAVHVRRGDYITNSNANSYHGVMPISYYVEALKILKLKKQNLKIFYFSDDPFWIQDNLVNVVGEGTIISHNNGTNSFWDMILMSYCKHFILANSSFSWWGAWLAQNSAKIVVAPQKWFTNAEINTSDLIPPEWLRL